MLALDKRTAITFTPGVPPIWTTLVRYYEESLVGRQPGHLERFLRRRGWSSKSAALLVHGVLARSVHFSKERWVDHGRGWRFFEVMKDAISAIAHGLRKLQGGGGAEIGSDGDARSGGTRLGPVRR